MTIEEVDFNSDEFSRPFKHYCLYSAPFDDVGNSNSLSGREIAIDRYLEELRGKDLSICIRGDDGGLLFFVFFEKRREFLELLFAFPNQSLNLSVDTMRDCFYRLCLEGLDRLNYEDITGKIRRSNKKNKFIIFLRRYIKALSYEIEDNLPYDIIRINKKDLVEYYEKL